MGDFYDIDYRDSMTSNDKTIVYYFNEKTIHQNIKHVNIEALVPGESSAYTVKFEFDQKVKVNREYDQDTSVHSYLRSTRQKTLALSRALACQPKCTAQIIPYPHFPRAYKVIDYGHPNTSFYGLVVVAN